MTKYERIKDNFCRLINKVINYKTISHKKYKGKIFRYNTKGMYLIPRIKLRVDEFRQFIQRGKCSYSYVDVYSISCWFLDNIVNLLHDMILDLHGYPINFESFEDWKCVLETMYECFRQANENTCDEKYVEDYKYRHDMLKSGLDLFVKYFDDLWD